MEEFSPPGFRLFLIAAPPMEFTVTEAEATERLDRVLAARVPALSRMRLRQHLEQGEVLVNTVPQHAGHRVRLGDTIALPIDPDALTAMTPELIPLHILHEEAEFIVVEKPSGMVVHPAGRHRGGTLVNALAYHFNVAGAADPPIRPGLVHRLDRATSGVMVVAKTQRALSRLTVAFQQKRVEKRYMALVHGADLPDSGEWEAPIGHDPEALPRWGIRPDGRPAATRYWVRSRTPDYALLELEPVTGRTNQLRLHCAHFGHPILGDDLFGRGPEPGLDRLFLHAYRLQFPHPTTGAPCSFDLPLSPELDQFLTPLLP